MKVSCSLLVEDEKCSKSVRYSSVEGRWLIVTWGQCGANDAGGFDFITMLLLVMLFVTPRQDNTKEQCNERNKVE